MLEVCDHEFEFRSVSVVVYFSPNSTAWYRKRKGGDLHFIKIMVKSKCDRVVKQKRSNVGICKAVIVIDYCVYLL